MPPPAIEISSDHRRIDVTAVHAFLTSSYWAAGRPREVVERSIQQSLCFGAYDGSKQVGFGRVVTDQAVFAYLADVFVIEEYRGRGIGRALVAAMLKDPRLALVRQFLLRTRDAHGVYEALGFEAAPRPNELMARVLQDPTRNATSDVVAPVAPGSASSTRYSPGGTVFRPTST